MQHRRTRLPSETITDREICVHACNALWAIDKDGREPEHQRRTMARADGECAEWTLRTLRSSWLRSLWAMWAMWDHLATAAAALQTICAKLL